MDYCLSTVELINKKFDLAKNEMKLWWEYLKESNKVLVFWGTGALGHILFECYKEKNIRVDYFCDNNKRVWGKEITNYKVKCISPDQLYELENVIVIPTTRFNFEIKEQLKEKGIQCWIPKMDMLSYAVLERSNLFDYDKEYIVRKIQHVFSCLADELSEKCLFFKVYGWFANSEEINLFDYDSIYSNDIYRLESLVFFDDKSCILDCGAYDGDTLNDFVTHNIPFNKYYCYEIDEENVKKVQNRVQNYMDPIKEKIIIVNNGVGKEEGLQHYYMNNFSSLLLLQGEEKVRIVTIDTEFKDKKVSYIKMDIEGSELDALQGAEKVIMRDKPDCAICIYHKADDLWEIPLLLKAYNKNYKIYIRQHLKEYYDTVCYAINN